MLGDRDHVVAHRLGALDHSGLVGAGDTGFPGLGDCLEAQHVRQGEGEFHSRILAAQVA
jgi:hypothetical protein